MTRKTSPIWLIETEALNELIENCNTITDILGCMGLKNRGANYKTLRKRLDQEGIAWPTEASRRGLRKGSQSRTIPMEEILVKKSTYKGGSHLKHRLIKEGYLKDICSICSQEPMWNGKPLSLELDHINGISNDNRISNLRIVCPHCHSQTKTFRGRSKKKSKNLTKKQIESNVEKLLNRDLSRGLKHELRICLLCSASFTPNSYKQKYCSTHCAKKAQRKIEPPCKERLEELIWEYPRTKLGTIFGVSDNTIRNWCKEYNISTPPRGYFLRKKKDS